MALPELIYAPIEGGTIHRYEISGGKRKFLVSIFLIKHGRQN